MSFTVKILGTGAAIPTIARGTTSHLVNCKQRLILIDCGEGTQLQMRKFGAKFQDIQIILISHLHGDHILGLPGLLGTMQLLGRTKPIRIYGPTGIKEFVKMNYKLAGLREAMPIKFTEFSYNHTGVVFEDKVISIKTFPLNHRIQTQGYRIDEKPGKRHLDNEAFEKTGISVAYIDKLTSGEDVIDNKGVEVKSEDVTLPPTPPRSYAFCSDTSYFPDIIPHIENVDLLYHEATFIDKEADRAHETFHSTAKQAASIALKANAKRLIIGHFSGRYKSTEEHKIQAEEIFEKVFVPEDGEFFNV